MRLSAVRYPLSAIGYPLAAVCLPPTLDCIPESRETSDFRLSDTSSRRLGFFSELVD